MIAKAYRLLVQSTHRVLDAADRRSGRRPRAPAARFAAGADRLAGRNRGLGRRALGAEALAPLVGRAESLLVRMAGIAVAQGEEEATAVRRGLSYWPDVADLEIPSLG